MKVNELPAARYARSNMITMDKLQSTQTIVLDWKRKFAKLRMGRKVIKHQTALEKPATVVFEKPTLDLAAVIPFLGGKKNYVKIFHVWKN